MALDTLEIFGDEFTNVAGIKAVDDNDQIKTYIRPQGTLTISAGGTGIDVTEYASVDVATGTAGTPTATKGTVSAHRVSVTPSVTNTTGYITGSTKTGTAVQVTASELVSGNKSITENGTGIDVTNYATVSVAVEPSLQETTVTPSSSVQVLTPSSGYDGFSKVTVNAASGASIGTKTVASSSSSNTSLAFSSLSGEPKAFFVRLTTQLTRSSSYTYYYITAVRYNGTNTYGNYWRMSNGTFYADTSHYSFTYSSGTLTVSSSASRSSAGGSFYAGDYELTYVY